MVSKKITKQNYKKIVVSGRARWKIENEGFNTQKNHGYEIGHVFCEDYNAMKNHYLLAQIAHIIRQLMEKGLCIFKKYKKSLKDISYNILEALRNVLLSEEDIKYTKAACQIRFCFENTS